MTLEPATEAAPDRDRVPLPVADLTLTEMPTALSGMSAVAVLAPSTDVVVTVIAPSALSAAELEAAAAPTLLLPVENAWAVPTAHARPPLTWNKLTLMLLLSD